MNVVVGMVVLSVGFGLLRFTGQGLLTLSSRTMISQWFDRRRGIVTSLSSTFMSFMFAASPALLLALIDIGGFRWAWRLMALVLVVVIVPDRAVSRHTGELRTRDRWRPRSPANRSSGSDADLTLAEAIRDLRFWAVAAAIAAMSATSTALTFHIIDFGAEVGLSADEIVRIFVPIALVSVPVTLLGGWLVDVISPITIAVAMSVAQLVMYLTSYQVALWISMAVPGLGLVCGFATRRNS